MKSGFFSAKKFTEQIDDIKIYTINLPDFIGIVSFLSDFLNPAELSRFERFHKEKDKNQFIITRSILKFILSAHAGIDVKNITLDYHSNKKPYLASHPKLFFNVSHSEDYAVITISNKEVGIDLEYISENFDYTIMLPTIFSENEILAIENAVDKKRAFYTSWTRKESFVKALGKGIDDDFITIPCLEGQHCLAASFIGSNENWQLDSFEINEKYMGALAYCKTDEAKKIQMINVPNKMDALLAFIKVQKS